MKAGFTILAKLLAIFLSLSLLGAYVYWRANKAKKEQVRLEALDEAREQAMEALKKEMAHEEGDDDELGEALLQEFEVMGSSKSGRVLIPSSKQSRVVMPGSKSFDPVPVDPNIEALEMEEEKFRKLVEEARKAKEAKDNARQRILLPSPKYAPMDLEPTGIEDLEPKQETQHRQQK